jgi:type II secretory pathway pseudopilin PulG
MTIKHSKGFTLVEIIFSIAFLSIVSVVILQLFLTSNALGKRAQIQNFATLYAANAIEEAKATDLDFFEMTQTTYFDELWQPATENQFSYKVTLTLEKHDSLATLHFLVAHVTDVENQTLAILESAHPQKGGR